MKKFFLHSLLVVLLASQSISLFAMQPHANNSKGWILPAISGVSCGLSAATALVYYIQMKKSKQAEKENLRTSGNVSRLSEMHRLAQDIPRSQPWGEITPLGTFIKHEKVGKKAFEEFQSQLSKFDPADQTEKIKLMGLVIDFSSHCDEHGCLEKNVYCNDSNTKRWKMDDNVLQLQLKYPSNFFQSEPYKKNTAITNAFEKRKNKIIGFGVAVGLVGAASFAGWLYSGGK